MDLIERIRRLRERRASAATVESVAEITRKLDEATDHLKKRNVTTYGAINLRTDGHKVVLAYRLEQRSTSAKGGIKGWDIYRLEPAGGGSLAFVR